LFVRCDDPSSHFSTVAMKIENRLSTLTNKIKENLSLLGDGCSLLTLVNNEKNVVTQSRTGLQIYEGRDDQLNRPGPMA
jgi:hypothetical protein